MTIALVDIESGNLRSVENALRAAGAEDISVTADPECVAAADRIVLPGVGAFGHCAAKLRAADGLVPALEAAVFERGRPFLGICVGMQLMAAHGEEHGTHAGMGWIDGKVAAIPEDPAIRIPHMGWNDVRASEGNPLIENGEAYFLHSYALRSAGQGDAVIATTDHGGEIVAAVRRDTAIGVQFHPEKSQRYGLDLLARFLRWKP